MAETTSAPITVTSDPERISVELSARRTGMSFQRTRLKDVDALSGGVHAARDFGTSLVWFGIGMLVLGIGYHVQFMYGLRQERKRMATSGLIHAQSLFPPSLTLITALVLLMIGIAAIGSMVFHIGPFG